MRLFYDEFLVHKILDMILRGRSWTLDPASVIVVSLLISASASVGNAAVSVLVKDAYDNFKHLWQQKYPNIEIEQFEKSSSSIEVGNQVREVIIALRADRDLELLEAARDNILAFRQNMPEVIISVGIDLKDVEAGNLRLSDITATGVGIRVEHSKFTGDIEIKGVRAGVAAADPNESR